jgi:hypothetical protein
MLMGQGEGVDHRLAGFQHSFANLLAAAGGLDDGGRLAGLLLIEVPANRPAVANRSLSRHSEMHKPVGNACLGLGGGKRGGGHQ